MPKPAQDVRHEKQLIGQTATDADRIMVPPFDCVHIAAGALIYGLHILEVAKEDPAFFRQLHAARLPEEQLGAKGLFQRGDGPRQTRLGDVQVIRRRRHISQFGNLQKDNVLSVHDVPRFSRPALEPYAPGIDMQERDSASLIRG